MSLKNQLKPGRWYRFRVAAISASGTRGYSTPSAPFTPRKGPRPPPPPKKLKVLPIRSNNSMYIYTIKFMYVFIIFIFYNY